jgi:alkylation response protein AidB-like acyl-CoA dehydrogenase
VNALTFRPPPPSSEAEAAALRPEVREFPREELTGRKPVEKAESWTGMDADFSRKMGQRGWVGMTWPREYGCDECSSSDRYMVQEKMLAAGAPVALHSPAPGRPALNANSASPRPVIARSCFATRQSDPQYVRVQIAASHSGFSQ